MKKIIWVSKKYLKTLRKLVRIFLSKLKQTFEYNSTVTLSRLWVNHWKKIWEICKKLDKMSISDRGTVEKIQRKLEVLVFSWYTLNFLKIFPKYSHSFHNNLKVISTSFSPPENIGTGVLYNKKQNNFRNFRRVSWKFFHITCSKIKCTKIFFNSRDFHKTCFRKRLQKLVILVFSTKYMWPWIMKHT